MWPLAFLFWKCLEAYLILVKRDTKDIFYLYICFIFNGRQYPESQHFLIQVGRQKRACLFETLSEFPPYQKEKSTWMYFIMSNKSKSYYLYFSSCLAGMRDIPFLWHSSGPWMLDFVTWIEFLARIQRAINIVDQNFQVLMCSKICDIALYAWDNQSFYFQIIQICSSCSNAEKHVLYNIH